MRRAEDLNIIPQFSTLHLELPKEITLYPVPATADSEPISFNDALPVTFPLDQKDVTRGWFCVEFVGSLGKEKAYIVVQQIIEPYLKAIEPMVDEALKLREKELKQIDDERKMISVGRRAEIDAPVVYFGILFDGIVEGNNKAFAEHSQQFIDRVRKKIDTALNQESVLSEALSLVPTLA